MKRLFYVSGFRTVAGRARPLSLQRRCFRKMPPHLGARLTDLGLSAGRNPRSFTTTAFLKYGLTVADPFLTPKNDNFPDHQVYAALGPEENKMRLVSLAPGIGNDRIECELFEASLVSPPPSEALSYCAGDPKDCAQIWLNRLELHRQFHSINK